MGDAPVAIDHDGAVQAFDAIFSDGMDTPYGFTMSHTGVC